MPVEILRLEASGWLARSQGKNDEALRLLREAADREDAADKHAVSPGWIVPAREQLAKLLLELVRPGDALREYQSALRVTPNRFNALSGAADAAAQAKETALAKQFYEKLLEIAAPSSKRPEVTVAKAFVSGKSAAGKSSLKR